MNTPHSVQVTFRIPGNWSDLGELIRQIPSDYRLTPEGLVLPDGTLVEAYPVPPDDQFGQVFISSCRQPLTREEQNIIKHYTANMILLGPGGSLESAYRMMQAANAILDAGGAGVFIDNGALSHSRECWKQMVDDGGPDAISFAFVSIIRGENRLRTVGMHVLGYPDFELTSDGQPIDEQNIISIIRYVSLGEKPIAPGHLIFDENGLQFRATESTRERFDLAHPMHNPFGYLKLVSLKEITENN